MPRRFVTAALCLLALHGAARAADLPAADAPAGDAPEARTARPMKGSVEPAPGVGMTWELDAYYSSLGVELPLDDRPVPDGGTMRERDVYRTLFRESLHPRVLLLEASVYPAPAAGAWFRKHHPDDYDDFVIGEAGNDELNLIQGLTAGFQEPWAVSAFVGGEMSFTRPGAEKRRQNRGYMGYLASFGRKHIRENVLIDDTWWEVEWKLKGEREFRDERLNWSFRVGIKNHGNVDIRDVAYLGFKRSNLDFRRPFLSFLDNSTVEVVTEVARDNGNFMRQEIIVGKKLPIRRWRIAAALDVGFIFEEDSKYTGALADPTVDRFTLVFRPNIDW